VPRRATITPCGRSGPSKRSRSCSHSAQPHAAEGPKQQVPARSSRAPLRAPPLLRSRRGSRRRATRSTPSRSPIPSTQARRMALLQSSRVSRCSRTGHPRHSPHSGPKSTSPHPTASTSSSTCSQHMPTLSPPPRTPQQRHATISPPVSNAPAADSLAPRYSPDATRPRLPPSYRLAEQQTQRSARQSVLGPTLYSAYLTSKKGRRDFNTIVALAAGNTATH
jgi:hypothetical protein